MRSVLLLACLLVSSVSFSAQKENSSSADWVTEVGTMLVSGKAAQDLYYSLNAPEVRDPLSTNYDETRTKENVFAKCNAKFYRIDLENGDVEWVMDNVSCLITAPAGTTINQ